MPKPKARALFGNLSVTKQPRNMLSFISMFYFLVTCALPLAPHVAVLGVIMFFHGFCLGALDTGIIIQNNYCY